MRKVRIFGLLRVNRWCELGPERRVSPGEFLESTVQLKTKQALESEAALLGEWARRLMLRYESQPTTALLVLDDPPIEQPRRTKRFYRRLFDPNTGEPMEALREWAGEVLGEWMEQTLEPDTEYTAGNAPHSTDPAFDVLSVFLDGAQLRKLRVVQVKVTEGGLQPNCNRAVAKFEKLESGEYQADLVARLALLIEAGRLGPDASVDSLAFENSIAYRITVVHGEDRSAVQILTLYEQKIAGPLERRSLRLGRPAAWSVLWEALATSVYAQLTD